ncbi:MAG: EamA family transporter RarD [Defluviitaleaceae bacterium]|nr:EamA family transporter RarD [Defluviitaleaceae bacterium]
MEQIHKSPKKGFIAAIAAQLTWGMLVFYWKSIESISAYEILAMRVIMSVVTAVIILSFKSALKDSLIAMKDKKFAGMILIAGLIIVSNWGMFIYAVNNGFILESALGYFISPILTVLCGVIFFKEKPDKYIIVSVIFVSLAVIYMTISYGRPPFIALYLAITFSGYLTVKKKINAEPVAGLFLESLVVTPFALIFVIFLMVTGASSILTATIPINLLLLLSGAVTMTPLMFVMIAQKHISMLIYGILSYIAPTMQMLIGVFVYSEEFTMIEAVSLVAVICAISYFTFGQYKKSQILASTNISKPSLS